MSSWSEESCKVRVLLVTVCSFSLFNLCTTSYCLFSLALTRTKDNIKLTTHCMILYFMNFCLRVDVYYKTAFLRIRHTDHVFNIWSQWKSWKKKFGWTSCDKFEPTCKSRLKFHHNGNLITEQGTGEQTPLFQLVIDTMLTSATTWKQKQINTPPTHSNQFQLFHNSNRQQYGYVNHSLFYRTYCIFCRIYIIKNNCNFNLIYRHSLTVKI